MKKVLMISTLLVAAALLLAPTPKEVKNVPPAVIQIGFSTVEDGKPATRTCSAFYINLIQLITAAHCIPEDGNVLINMRSGEILRVVKQSESLALLESQPTNVMPLKLAKRIEMGEQVYTFGYAYGESFVGYQRNAAGKYGIDLILDGPLSSGMSGGPVVNLQGEVIGVNQASTNSQSYICTVVEIKELIGAK